MEGYFIHSIYNSCISLINQNHEGQVVPVMSSIGVLGAGTWGMALARMLACSNHNVTVWSALGYEIDELSTKRVHPKLPGVRFPETIDFTKDISKVCLGKEIIILAVPSPFIRSTTKQVIPYLNKDQIIVSVAKGIEKGTLFTMTEIIEDELKNVPELKEINIVALSGPTHAEEVAIDMPTTIVSACNDSASASKVQDIFSNTCMRVYRNPDIKGVELCGALKNIIALAAGILSGLGYGDNTKAALITRGLTEITRLGVAMGCKEKTFYGLAGIGDLIVTATSVHSRNNTCGRYIGQGLSSKDAVEKVGMVVEGINAIPAAMELKDKYGVELPIIEAVDAVINRGTKPSDAVMSLMLRDKKDEIGFENIYGL